MDGHREKSVKLNIKAMRRRLAQRTAANVKHQPLVQFGERLSAVSMTDGAPVRSMSREETRRFGGDWSREKPSVAVKALAAKLVPEVVAESEGHPEAVCCLMNVLMDRLV
jgi:hypothetical protein